MRSVGADHTKGEAMEGTGIVQPRNESVETYGRAILGMRTRRKAGSELQEAGCDSV